VDQPSSDIRGCRRFLLLVISSFHRGRIPLPPPLSAANRRSPRISSASSRVLPFPPPASVTLSQRRANNLPFPALISEHRSRYRRRAVSYFRSYYQQPLVILCSFSPMSQRFSTCACSRSLAPLDISFPSERHCTVDAFLPVLLSFPSTCSSIPLRAPGR